MPLEPIDRRTCTSDSGLVVDEAKRLYTELCAEKADYPLTAIPVWCHMSLSNHQDGLGGCWGISYGKVAELGESHCKSCEFYGKKEC